MKHNLTKGRMDDFFILRMGKTPPRDNSDYWLNGTNNWVAISDMGKSKYISATSECITDKGIADCNMVPVPTNTVIMSFKLSIGKTAITSKPIFTNEAIMSFLPKTEFADNILVDYIYYYLLGHRWGGTGKKAVMGVTLNKASLSATPFSFPSLADQKQAIAELNKINETIEDCRELLRNLDALAQSLFYDFFGDPVTNPKGFIQNKLKEVAIVKIGPFGSLLHKEDYINGGTPLVNPVHMLNGYVKIDKDFSIDDDKKELFSSYLLRTNDIVFGRRGDIGRCALITAEEDGFLCGTGSLFVRFYTQINSLFALWCFMQPSVKKFLIDKAKGATMLNINCGIVESIPLILPPLELQEKFAERIEQIEAQKKVVESTIAELQTLLDSRMDYWFN